MSDNHANPAHPTFWSQVIGHGLFGLSLLLGFVGYQWWHERARKSPSNEAHAPAVCAAPVLTHAGRTQCPPTVTHPTPYACPDSHAVTTRREKFAQTLDEHSAENARDANADAGREQVAHPCNLLPQHVDDSGNELNAEGPGEIQQGRHVLSENPRAGGCTTSKCQQESPHG